MWIRSWCALCESYSLTEHFHCQVVGRRSSIFHAAWRRQRSFTVYRPCGIIAPFGAFCAWATLLGIQSRQRQMIAADVRHAHTNAKEDAVNGRK
jgi:hypothetical protein